VICPKCHADYVPGVAVCYDCEVDLVAALPPEPPATSEGEQAGDFSLVTVYATPDLGLLAIAETMLESAGIPHLVEGAAYRGAVGGGVLGIYAVHEPSLVRVAPQDADDARELLADLGPEG
jgi:hypothetical protein